MIFTSTQIKHGRWLAQLLESDIAYATYFVFYVSSDHDQSIIRSILVAMDKSTKFVEGHVVDRCR